MNDKTYKCSTNCLFTTKCKIDCGDWRPPEGRGDALTSRSRVNKKVGCGVASHPATRIDDSSLRGKRLVLVPN